MGLLLNLAQFHMFKAGEFKTDLDSADGFINQAKQLNVILKSRESEGYILLEESYLANEYKERVKGKQLLEAAIGILEKEKNHYLLGKAYMSMADYFDVNNTLELPDRMRSFKKAIAAFNKVSNIEREAYAYRMLAETDTSDLTSEEYLDKSLSLYNSINYQELQGVYVLYASVYIIRSNFPEALKWGLKALKTAEAVGDSSMQLCTINNHIAIIYHNNRDSVNAVKYYTAALHIAERYNDKFSIYLLTHNIAIIYFNKQQPLLVRDLLQRIEKKYGLPDKHDAITHYRFVGDLLKVYTLLKQFDLAEPYCRQLIDIGTKNKFRDEDLNDGYVNILDYYLASRQFALMPVYLTKVEAMTKTYRNPRNARKLQLIWFCYDTSLHNYRSAVNHLLQYSKINGTINTQARERAVKELQVRFDTEKKEDQIVLLNKEKLLEKANVKQATLLKNMTIAGIVVALIIAGLLYRQSGIRKKNNIVVTHKNKQLQHLVTEKEWLLKEVHHRVKNNLHTVIGLLESQAANLQDDALKANEISKHRIYAMSLIHQQLYKGEDVKTIDMSVYIPELLDYLGESFGTDRTIQFQYEIEPLQLDVAQAVPVGLIVNEAVTNAIKYAFPNRKAGIIRVSLQQLIEEIELIVADNGIGIDPRILNTASTSMGLKLMRGLTEDIHGEIEITQDKGTRIEICFHPDLMHAFSAGSNNN
jgi:two-component sensor histidine kinase